MAVHFYHSSKKNDFFSHSSPFFHSLFWFLWKTTVSPKCISTTVYVPSNIFCDRKHKIDISFWKISQIDKSKNQWFGNHFGHKLSCKMSWLFQLTRRKLPSWKHFICWVALLVSAIVCVCSRWTCCLFARWVCQWIDTKKYINLNKLNTSQVNFRWAHFEWEITLNRASIRLLYVLFFFLLIYSTLFVCTFFVSLSERKKTKKKISKLNNLEAKRRRPQTETLSNLSRVCVVFLFFCYNRLSKSDMHARQQSHNVCPRQFTYTTQSCERTYAHTHAHLQTAAEWGLEVHSIAMSCVSISNLKIKIPQKFALLKIVIGNLQTQKNRVYFLTFWLMFFCHKFFFLFKNCTKMTPIKKSCAYYTLDRSKITWL